MQKAKGLVGDSQQGVVLVTVMIILVVVTLIAADLYEDLHALNKVTAFALTKDQASSYVRGAESLAMIALKADQDEDERSGQALDHDQEEWGGIQTFPVDGGLISGRILDRQGLFNLNDLLGNETAQTVFLRLLAELNIPSNEQLSAQDLLNALLDWQDADQELRGVIDTEDYFYFEQQPAYKTSSQTLSHLSELRLIRGFTAEDTRKLAAHVTLLPQGTPININSISSAFARALNPAQGGDLYSNRPDTGYEDKDLKSLSKAQKPALAYTSKSQFFVLRTQVELGDHVFRVRSYLFRPLKVESSPPMRIMGRDSGDLRLSL